MDIGCEKWSRLHVSTNSYFTMTSNKVESMNTVTKVAKNTQLNHFLSHYDEWSNLDFARMSTMHMVPSQSLQPDTRSY